MLNKLFEKSHLIDLKEKYLNERKNMINKQYFSMITDYIFKIITYQETQYYLTLSTLFYNNKEREI